MSAAPDILPSFLYIKLNSVWRKSHRKSRWLRSLLISDLPPRPVCFPLVELCFGLCLKQHFLTLRKTADEKRISFRMHGVLTSVHFLSFLWKPRLLLHCSSYFSWFPQELSEGGSCSFSFLPTRLNSVLKFKRQLCYVHSCTVWPKATHFAPLFSRALEQFFPLPFWLSSP